MLTIFHVIVYWMKNHKYLKTTYVTFSLFPFAHLIFSNLPRSSHWPYTCVYSIFKYLDNSSRKKSKCISWPLYLILWAHLLNTNRNWWAKAQMANRKTERVIIINIYIPLLLHGKSILHSFHTVMKRYQSETHECTALTAAQNECICHVLLLHPKWGQSYKVVLNIKTVCLHLKQWCILCLYMCLHL